MKSRVNKNCNTYCWMWSASEYESIEENRKKWIKENIVNKNKQNSNRKKNKKKYKKV